jgi:hypothetical protein
MAKIGRIIPDRGSSKPAPKPAPKPAGPTKAQIEADERARAAAAAKQAAANADAARQRKAEVERQERAQAAAAAQAAADRAEAARRTKAEVERQERAEEAARQQRSNQGRRPDNWNEMIHDDRNARGITWDPKEQAAREQAERDRAAQAERDRLAREQAERDRLAREQAARDQAERDRLAREQAERDRAAQAARDQAERDRLAREAAERAAEEARLDALARMPIPLVTASREPVKYATPDDVLIDTNDLPVDLILKLTLEKIGGMELISLVRHDILNGQNIVYRPVKNISQIAIDYNPQNIIKMPDSADSYFKNFSIKLENHIQQTTNELPPLVAYIDETTQNVVIDLVNLKADYEVEVQMVSSGKVFNDTIYTEDS